MYVLIYCIRTFLIIIRRRAAAVFFLLSHRTNGTPHKLVHSNIITKMTHHIETFKYLALFIAIKISREGLLPAVWKKSKIMINKKMIDIVAHHHKLHSSTHHMTYIKKTFKNIYQSRRIRRRCFPVVSEVISSNEDLNHPREAMQK